MGCQNTKPVNANHTVFQILREYPKYRKELRKSFDLKKVEWRTWSTCLRDDIYPEGFLSKDSEQKITKGRVAVLVEPLWSGKRNIIIFYRKESGDLDVVHISLPGNLFENPVEVNSFEEMTHLDDTVKWILVTRRWFFLTRR